MGECAHKHQSPFYLGGLPSQRREAGDLEGTVARYADPLERVPARCHHGPAGEVTRIASSTRRSWHSGVGGEGFCSESPPPQPDDPRVSPGEDSFMGLAPRVLLEREPVLLPSGHQLSMWPGAYRERRMMPRCGPEVDETRDATAPGALRGEGMQDSAE